MNCECIMYDIWAYNINHFIPYLRCSPSRSCQWSCVLRQCSLQESVFPYLIFLTWEIHHFHQQLSFIFSIFCPSLQLGNQVPLKWEPVGKLFLCHLAKGHMLHGVMIFFQKHIASNNGWKTSWFPANEQLCSTCKCSNRAWNLPKTLVIRNPR